MQTARRPIVASTVRRRRRRRHFAGDWRHCLYVETCGHVCLYVETATGVNSLKHAQWESKSSLRVCTDNQGVKGEIARRRWKLEREWRINLIHRDRMLCVEVNRWMVVHTPQMYQWIWAPKGKGPTPAPLCFSAHVSTEQNTRPREQKGWMRWNPILTLLSRLGSFAKVE